MLIFIINFIGICLILVISWWFWLGKKNLATLTNAKIIEIIVDGGIYVPDTIRVKKNSTITLRFIRQDASPCAATVVFRNLGISQELPVKQPYDVILNLDTPGEYDFTCAMGMYRGKLIVENFCHHCH